MSAPTMTSEEAHRLREGAVVRRHAASGEVDSMSRAIALSDVRHHALGRTYSSTTAEVMCDELIVLRAAEHEAFADWHDARALCGFKAVSR